MKHVLLCAAVVTTGLTFAGASLAQFTGSNGSKFTDIESLLGSGSDDDYVQLEGNLIRKVGSEKYIFTDGKSEIRVEIESEDFPQQSFDESATIRITGEFEKDFMESPEIDVDSVTIISQ
ncbi:YgiW/YdeI family stress tolerance OB fold protein [Alteromonas antoniana]|uniref:YgiW/YdeI family stress tolerance OB fold protein n=1 Tax=Alteromonas antoniana TaxID=2803813 RepID=UPI001C466BCF|nr:NirD/YgiW/YdeI family stress tolerance protein [Alteromonas antoniana]